MNTEHTNQSRQAANAAFEQWWQRHGLEDPMDDEDRYYITASSWARRGYLAAMQAQQAEATLCASCARANMDCPIYPQQTASCVEHRPAAQQQAEPVAYLKTAADVMQLSFEGNPVVAVGADIEVPADTVQPLFAHLPAQRQAVATQLVCDALIAIVSHSGDPAGTVAALAEWRKKAEAFTRNPAGQQQAEPVALSLPFFAYDSETGFERFATDAEAKQYVQDGIDECRSNMLQGEAWPSEIENLCWGVVLGTTKEIKLGDADDGSGDYYSDYVLTDAAQSPAVAVPVPDEWCSPSNTPIVALGDALHCWLAVKSKHDSKVRVYDAYYCNFPLMQDEAGDFPDWTLHDESGEEVAMVGWAEKVAHPDFNDFYSALGDIELIGWQPVNPPVAPTAVQKGGEA